jgi:hypothetical protein
VLRKIPLLATILMVGCADMTGPQRANVGLSLLEKENQQIQVRERSCISEALARASGQIPRAASPDQDAHIDLQTDAATNSSDHEVSLCKTTAEQLRDHLFAREREDYESGRKLNKSVMH